MNRPARAKVELPLVAGVMSIAFVGVVASIEGSPLQPVEPAGFRPPAPLRFAARVVGLDAMGSTAQAVVGIVAMVVAAAAFLYVLRAAWRGELSVRLVTWVGIAFVAFAVALPLLFSRDVYAYAMYGRISSIHHANPYVATPREFSGDPLYRLVGPQWHDTTAVYGPAFNLLSAGLTRWLHGPVALIWAYKALAGAGAVATTLLVARVAGRLWPERAAFATALVAWNPVVLFHDVAGGHNDVLVGLAIVGSFAVLAGGGGKGVREASAGRELAATAILAVGTLVKAAAAIPLVLLVAAAVWRRPREQRLRTLAVHAAVVAGIGAVFAAPFFQLHDPTFGLASLASHEGWLAPTRFFRVALGHLAHAVGGSGAKAVVQTIVRVAFPLVFAVAFAGILRQALRRSREMDASAQAVAWAWALLVALLCAPVLWPWYVVWMLPLAWLLPRTPRLAVVVLSSVVAVSHTVAAAVQFPEVFKWTLFTGHYVLTPILILVLAVLLRDLRSRLTAGVTLGGEVGAARPEHREIAAAGQRG